jgi:hypothetical protein
MSFPHQRRRGATVLMFVRREPGLTRDEIATIVDVTVSLSGIRSISRVTLFLDRRSQSAKCVVLLPDRP